MTRRLSDVTPAELRIAVHGVVKEQGRSEGWHLFDAVATSLGGSLTDPRSLGTNPDLRWELGKAQDKWRGTVRRALRKLTDQGIIIAVPRNTTGPDGWASNTMYYTREEYQQAQERSRQRQREAEAREARWTSIRDRLLKGTGIALDRNHKLTPEDWELLLESGGW